ncbi:MAG: hypothetical protein R3C26_24310 [Calditrichia bacterium]
MPAFANPLVAERISEMIDSQLTEPGAIDVTETIRGHSRLVRDFGCTFLLPTVTFCADHHHPLANTEFLFPYLSVCESPQNEILHQIGSSLVVTAITNDEAFIRELFASPHVERLNIGALPTYRISWDQTARRQLVRTFVSPAGAATRDLSLEFLEARVIFKFICEICIDLTL